MIKMNKQHVWLMCLVWIWVAGIQCSYAGEAVLKPGIIVDELNEKSRPFLAELKREFRSLLSQRVQIDDAYILDAGWSAEKAAAHYRRLANADDVNLIITLGVLSSGVAVGKRPFIKPVIAVGVIEPEIQNLPSPENNRSHILNLSYIIVDRTLVRDLDMLQTVCPFKNIGIIADPNIINALFKNRQVMKRTLDKLDSNATLVPFQGGLESVIQALTGTDAVYLLHLGRFENEEKQLLIQTLTERKIPVFGASGDDLADGVLATVAPPESGTKIIRRIVLNSEAVLDGKNMSELPVTMNLEDSLSINMETARKIGYSPPFSVLMQANAVWNKAADEDAVLGFSEVVALALKNNMTLALSRTDVALAEKDVKLTRSNYFPTLSASTTATMIDEDRAELMSGSTTEGTATGSLNVTQLLFSDTLNASMAFSKQALYSSGQRHEGNRLDTINLVSKAYFSVLKAKTLSRISSDNLELTKKHLDMARKREAAGFSGKSDVYRWQSSLETSKTQVIEAMKDHRLSRMALNRVMNRPLNQQVAIEDESVDGPLYRAYRVGKMFQWLENPMQFQQFCDFLVQEAMRNAPEIRELDALIKGYERELAAIRRERFIPTASLSGEAAHVFDRWGEGSDLPGLDPLDDQWSVSVNLSWPLYEGGAQSANKQKVLVQLKSLEQQMTVLHQTLEQNTREAVFNATHKAINLDASKKSSEYAKKSLELVQESYAKGKVAVSELVNAQNDSVSAELTYMNSIYDYLTAIFDVERAIGYSMLLAAPEQRREFNNRINVFMTSDP